jgi:hypothetical protein
MKRGEIWSGVGDGYADKPRPMLILQSEEKLISESIVVILVTSKETEKPSDLRVKIEPSRANGLELTRLPKFNTVIYDFCGFYMRLTDRLILHNSEAVPQ